MKLSADLYSLRSKVGDKRGIKILSETGFDCVDYSFYWVEDGKNMLNDDYAEYAKQVKTWIDECGMTCNQAHAPFDFTYENKFDLSDKIYVQLVRSIEFAGILGAENIVVHAINVPDDVDFYEYNYKFYKSFEPVCKRCNVHIAVENLFGWDKKLNCIAGILHTPKLMNDFVETLNSPWYCVCVDVGHVSITGMEPENYIAGLKKGIHKALHIQDTDYRNDSHVMPYLGKLNWDNITASLAKSGYAGDFTYEFSNYIKGFDDELLPAAYRLAAETGRYLIKKTEKAK